MKCKETATGIYACNNMAHKIITTKYKDEFRKLYDDMYEMEIEEACEYCDNLINKYEK